MPRNQDDNELENRDVIEVARPLGTPVQMSAAELAKMTVVEIKAELAGRKVPHLSKLRKADLLTLLKDSLHLPVLVHVEVPKKKKKNGSARKNGHADGHDGVDDAKDEKDDALAWNQHHPARKLLYDAIVAGDVPLDAAAMGPAEVHCKYSNTPEFQLKGMDYGEAFTRRLRGLRNIIRGDKSRSNEDMDALMKAMKNHPVPALTHKGRPQWNGSIAQALLQLDMSLGKHNTHTPAQLWESNEQCKQALSPNSFRWKLRQMTRTQKYLHTLKHDAEQKLRKNLKGTKSKLCNGNTNT